MSPQIPPELQRLWAGRDRQSDAHPIVEPEPPAYGHDEEDTALICFKDGESEPDTLLVPSQPILKETSQLTNISLFPVYSLKPNLINLATHHGRVSQ